jgi:hypothetical protein
MFFFQGFIMHLQDRFLKGEKGVQDIAEAEEEYPMENIDLTRDNFNLNKMILLASTSGKVSKSNRFSPTYM